MLANGSQISWPRSRLDEIFHHGFAQQVRRQQALRQDEIVEALDVELGTQGLLGGCADFEQARESVKIRDAPGRVRGK